MARVAAFAWLAVFLAVAQTPAPPAAAPPKPGSSAAIQARVAPPARILLFTARPESIQRGEPVTLQWAAENPTGVTLDPGIGRVRPRGSMQVSPPATTTFTLTVRGPNNTTLTRTVTVNVAGAGNAAAPSAPAATPASATPRMPDGKPDLSGVYNSGTAGGQNAPAPVLKPDAVKYKVVRGPNDTGLYADCMPTGVPGAFFVPYQWQIVQGLDRIVIIYEYPGIHRVIPTTGGPHQADLDPTWMGDSIGHWEGDTLVVDTVAFNDKTELPGGFHHTEALHVIERFKRVDRDNLQWEAVIEDPGVFEKPWNMTRTFPLRPELQKVDEFVCENNRLHSVFQKIAF